MCYYNWASKSCGNDLDVTHLLQWEDKIKVVNSKINSQSTPCSYFPLRVKARSSS